MDSTQGLKPTKPSKKVVNLQPCRDSWAVFFSERCYYFSNTLDRYHDAPFSFWLRLHSHAPTQNRFGTKTFSLIWFWTHETFTFRKVCVNFYYWRILLHRMMRIMMVHEDNFRSSDNGFARRRCFNLFWATSSVRNSYKFCTKAITKNMMYTYSESCIQFSLWHSYQDTVIQSR